MASSARRSTAGRPALAFSGLVVDSQVWASLGGQPQKGRASSVINRFILAAVAKRLFTLVGLSTTLAPRNFHMPDQSSGVSFRAAAVPSG